MKEFVLFILAVISSVTMFAQTVSNMVTIRDYRFSMMMTLNGSATATAVYDSYGKISTNFATIESLKYLYQGQEVDKYLSLYLFPSRMYSESEKRFYSPDPASQYFSPYLFVGGDPVNYIDEDGNEGKPIVFYGESTGPGIRGIGMPWHIRSMKAAGVDAYYLPMNTLAMDMPAPILKEWNGNVLIQTHTSFKGEIISEEKLLKEENIGFKYRGKLSREKIWFAVGDVHEYVVMEPQYLGDRLINFSERNRVPIRNVTIDGCQSYMGAGLLGDHLYERMPYIRSLEFKGEIPDHINVRGLVKGRLSYWSDPLTEKAAGIKEAAAEDIQMFAQTITGDLIYEKDETGKMTSGRHYLDDKGNPTPRIRGKSEFTDYANGRIAKNMQPFYETTKAFY